MNYPLISEYVEAIKAAEDNFDQLKHLRPVLDDDGQPVMSSGNFAVVFKMKDEQTGKLHAVKCFLREQEGRDEAYRQIAEELEYVSSTFLTPIKYLDKELFVDTSNSEESEFPVLLMDWVEGQTLDKYIREHIDDQYELSLLAYQFSRLAMWLLPQPFAHGDLKPDNILVKEDGTLVLVDYDGMYVPTMKGQKARELGSPDFRHPGGTEDIFDEHIDDFSLVSILLSLKAIALKPELLKQYGASDRLLFSENDYRNLSESQVMDALKALMQDTELATLYSLFILSSAQNNLSQASFRLLNLSRPQVPVIENLSTDVTEEDLANAWVDEYGVMYSADRKRLLKVSKKLNEIDYKIKYGTLVVCAWAMGGQRLNSITIPDTIINIGDYAFACNYRMRYCNIPSSVKVIGNNPWLSCYKIEHMDCESPFYLIEKGILYSSDYKTIYGLIKWGDDIIKINEHTKFIRNSAFFFANCYCSSNELFNKVMFPDNLKRIGAEAFYGCEKLGSLNIPNGVKSIEDKAFCCCEGLMSVTIPDSVTSIGAGAFSGCKGLSSVVIPDSVTSIGAEAFSGCSALSSVVIPDSVTSIGAGAFSGCSALSSIVIPDSVTTIEEELFCECEALSSISIPDSVINIEKSAFSCCYSLSSIAIPSGITCIGEKSFYQCESLSAITIPNSVITIGEWAFGGCEALASIIIPIGTRKKFEKLLPKYKNILVELEDGVWIVKSRRAFDEDEIDAVKSAVVISTQYGLSVSFDMIAGEHAGEKVEVPLSKQCKLSEGDVIDIRKARWVTLCRPGENDILRVDVEQGNIKNKEEDSTEMTNAFLEDVWTTDCGVKYSQDIKRLLKSGDHFDNYCSIINGIKVISKPVYSINETLTHISLPNGIKSLGKAAFKNCLYLFGINIPDSVTNIGEEAFFGCNHLYSIIIPDSITSIEAKTFYSCTNLNNITIPNSITFVGEDVFWGCDKLRHIYIPIGERNRFEKLLPENKDQFVELLDIKDLDGWKIKERKPFAPEEIAAVKRAEVVSSQYGNSVCFFMQSGGRTYIPLVDYSRLKVGDDVDLSKANVLTLGCNGKDDINKVET